MKISDANGDLSLALSLSKIVTIDAETVILSNTLDRELLYDASIIGIGNQSIIKVIGNINPFDLQGTQRCNIKEVKIEIDANNENDVFKITGNGLGECINNSISCTINTTTNNQGKFTGVRLTSDTSGIYDNNINVNIENCKNGIVLEGITTDSWVTHNLFYGCCIKRFTGTAFLIQENPSTSIINNIITDLRIIDQVDDNIEKIGIRLSGMSNVFSNLQIFNDSTTGIFYWLDLSATNIRSYNNSFIVGGVEGLIKDESNMVNHYFNLNIVKRPYSPTTFDNKFQPIRYGKSFISNILDNNFNRIERYIGQNCSFGKISNSIKITQTSQFGKFYTNLLEPSKYFGKYVTLTMKVKSNYKVFPIIVNSEISFLHGTPNYTQDYEIISVSKKIDNNNLTQVGLVFDVNAPIGSIAEIDWMVVNEGRLSPNENVPNIPYKANGIVKIIDTEDRVPVNHGLPFTIPLDCINISPINNLGQAKKWWIDSSSEGSFYIVVDSAPGAMEAKFAWSIEY
ncbi:hypothetical protein [Chryseobacterium sp. SIMBA_029]|uniref:hypothetical protein n=1 Tax=Chryseobacterium sp. SIMBA_029 TaxID=3085772 RepID=UPI00397B9124